MTVSTTDQAVGHLGLGERFARSARRDAAARFTVFSIRIAAVGLNFISQVVLARLMGLSDFGIVTTALAILNVASVPATLGYDNVAIRFVAVARADRNALKTLASRLAPGVLWANAATALIMGLLASAEAVSGHARLAESLALLVLVVPAFGMVRVAEGWLRGAGSIVNAQVNSGLVIPGIATVLLLPAALFASHHRVGAPAAIALRAFSTLVALGALAVLVRRTIRLSGQDSNVEPIPQVGELRRIGAVLCAGGAVTMLLMQVDVISVSYLKGTSNAGIYGAASRIALALNVAVVSANFILSPRVARLFAQGRNADLQREVSAAATWMALSMAVMCGVIFVGAGAILRIFGSGFTPATAPLRILLVGQLVNGITGPAAAVLSMTGHQAKALGALSATAVVEILALLIAVPRFGLNGAAWASTGAAVLVNLVMLRQVRGSLGIWTLPLIRLRGPSS